MLKKKRKNSELFSDNFFNSLFLVNKNEKKKVLRIVQKKDISFFLFYTDYRNLPSILANGICQLKNVELKKDEAYYVWSYLQHEESVDLEFDISSRAYFWKWATDAGINLENLCIIALDPVKLAQQTVNDWVFDTSLKLVGVHETIPAESIKWIMIRKERPLKKVEQMAKMIDPNIEVYYGNGSEIKRLSKKKVADPLLMISDEQPQQGEKKMSKKRNDRITARDVDFAKWYTDVVIQADLIDYAPVKGTMIFKPHGYGIWELIMQTLDAEFKQLGVENVYLPLLIPASLFNQEKEHIEGFAPEVLTVTKVGDKPLEEELYIRPTSEVLFSQYFKNNIHSYRDLPLKNNQWVNVMRWEKTTRPFLRTSEFLWQEGHTMHATSGEADQFALTILNLYAKFVEEYLLIPVIKGTKTINERFAGAKETYTIESLMHDGQALQTGTSHFLGDNFAKVFDIKFQNADGELEYAYGSSWGVSTRMIGALIMTHADDQGLVLPSKVAPVQVQILQLSSESLVQNVVDQLKATLIKDYRVKVDASEKTFGYKMASSEIKGVPIRIEVGMRDVAQEQVVISSRVGDNKTTVKLDQVKTFVDKALITYDQELFKRAKNSLETRIYQAQTLSEYQKGIATQPGLYLVPFCGRVVCEKEIKQKTSTNSRCIPFNHDQSVEPCFNCGQATKIKAYFGRAY